MSAGNRETYIQRTRLRIATSKLYRVVIWEVSWRHWQTSRSALFRLVCQCLHDISQMTTRSVFLRMHATSHGGLVLTLNYVSIKPLYGCQTWPDGRYWQTAHCRRLTLTLTNTALWLADDSRYIQSFHTSCQWQILGVR